jgi:hypothetical protein
VKPLHGLTSTTGCFTSPSGSLAGPLGRAALVLGGLTSSSLVLTLGMHLTEGRALLKHPGCPLIGRGQTLSYLPCASYGAFRGGVHSVTSLALLGELNWPDDVRLSLPPCAAMEWRRPRGCWRATYAHSCTIVPTSGI